MTTEDLIVRLAQSAGPVQPLAAPLVRLCRWLAPATVATVIGVALIGVRPDVDVMLRQGPVVAVAVMTLATASAAAAVALLLGVPGAERSPAQRWAPLGVGSLWGVMMAGSLLSGGSALDRVLAFPVHVSCVLQIAGLAVLPGWGLFTMLRRAAPVRHRWSGGIATLAAVALAAAGTQFICPINDPAHLLVSHFAVVAVFALSGAWLGQRVLES